MSDPLDPLVLRVPEDFYEGELVADLAETRVVPRVRGVDLGPVVTVALGTLGATSGFVTLAIARAEIADFGRRLVRRLGRDDDSGDERVIRLTFASHSTVLDIRSTDPGDDFLRAVVQLIQSSGSGQAAG